MALIKQCVLEHSHGEPTSPGSAIIWVVRSRLTACMLRNFLADMLVNCYAWRKKLLMNCALLVRKDYRHSNDLRPNLLCFLDVARTGLSAERAAGFVTKMCFEHCMSF